MRVIVVGGGIGGMAAAIALRNVGLDPLVLEQASALTEIGAGLGLSANAMKALDHLGAAAYLRERAVIATESVWHGLEDNEHIFTQQQALLAQRYGDHYYTAHRADLLESLVRVLPSEHVRLNSRVVAVDETSDGVSVVLESGEEVHGDILIGADGLKSRVRSSLFGEEEAHFTGIVTWRGLISTDKLEPKFALPRIDVWLGPRRHVMRYPTRKGQINLSGFVPAEEVHRESWAEAADVDDLRASFQGVCSEVATLLSAVESALITPIYFRDPLESWGTDRIVLLGDSAHPAPPSAGQGAAMALEDAVTLAACLRRHGPDDVAAAFQEYAARRRARTTRMLMGARIGLATFNESDPVQIRARNGRYRGLQRMDPLGETQSEWLYAHDPVAAAETPLEELGPDPATLVNPMVRPEAQRAFDTWKHALTLEDRSGRWIGERAGYERFAQREFPAADDVTVEEVDANGVPALRVVPSGTGSAAGPAVLHLHGGGFQMGSARSSVDLAARVAARVGGWALTIDYRLAPENAYPAALDDARAAYAWLLEQQGPSGVILLSGECAGGALAVSLAVSLRDGAQPLPAAIHVVSPFCDLSVTAASITDQARNDPWFNQGALRMLAVSYLHDADPEMPLVSPIHADLTGLPPLLIHAAEQEALADDARALAAAAEAAGVDVTLHMVADSVHSFVLFDFLPETDEALGQFAALARAAQSAKPPAA